MQDNSKIEEFLLKLAPCIQRGELDACAGEAARLAREMGVGADELLDLTTQAGMAGGYAFAYVLALTAAQGLEGKDKAGAYYNAGLAAKFLGRLEKAEEQYKKAIEADPNLSEAYSGYGLLLVESDNRKKALEKTELASSLFKESGRTIESHLAKAWFYQQYSEIYLKQKKYPESSEDADKAGDEYLKAAETAEGSLKDDLELQGNVLKAKYFVRKLPVPSWYRKIYFRSGKNPNISELTDNLKNAAAWYEKAN